MLADSQIANQSLEQSGPLESFTSKLELFRVPAAQLGPFGLPTMNQKFYNITAGYALASSAIQALYEIEEDFICFEDFVDYSTQNFLIQISSPQKESLLHVFLRNYEYSIEEWIFRKTDLSREVNRYLHYLKFAKIEPPEWLKENEIEENRDKLWELVERAIDIVADSAFEILFNDKEFLFCFQNHIRKIITNKFDTFPKEYFKKTFHVKRATYLPTWLAKAMFYRDRGRCQLCKKDVSGQVHIENKYHLDHILPLAESGTNDSTNFQLLCAECNLKKSAVIKEPVNMDVKYFG